MRITVHVTPNAAKACVTKVGELSFEVKVDERAQEGKANKRLLEILSEHFNVSKSKIRIVRGSRSREKIVEILLDGDVGS